MQKTMLGISHKSAQPAIIQAEVDMWVLQFPGAALGSQKVCDFCIGKRTEGFAGEISGFCAHR